MEQTSKPKQWAAPFFAIWTGQALSLFGSSLAGFALVWWLTKTTGSATVLATATLVAMLPQILLGPFAGALVDRWNRRLVMIVADSLVALISAWLAWLFWTGAMRTWHVYVIMLARALGGCFHWPAMQASTSLMVPKAHLSRVAGLNQTLNGGMNIVAPPLGALLLAALPLHGIMAIDVVTASLAIVPLFFVLIPQPDRPPATAGAAQAGATLWQDLAEGLRYVWAWPGLRLLLFMAVVLNFVGYPAFSLIPILVTKHFGGQALQLGWMNSGWGIGVVLGGLTLGVWGGFRRRVYTSLVGLIAGGLAALAVGLAPAHALWLALVGIFLAGFFNAITNGPLFAILQGTVDPRIQGRVFTVVGSVCAAMSPLGLAVAGPVADAFGVGTWFVVDGLSCVLMGVGAFFVPALVHLEDNHSKGRLPSQETPAITVTTEDLGLA